jgi:hypothetical protein
MLDRFEALHRWFRSALLRDGWTIAWSHGVEVLANARSCCWWDAALSARRGTEQLRLYARLNALGIVELSILRAPVTFAGTPATTSAGAPLYIDGETALESVIESGSGVLATSTTVTFVAGDRPVWVVAFAGGFRRCNVAGPGDATCTDRFAVEVDAGGDAPVPSAVPSG